MNTRVRALPGGELEGFGVRVFRTGPSAESARSLESRPRQPDGGDASLLVGGEYERRGSRLRVTARLTDTRTGAVVAAVSEEGAWDDVFALQDRITDGLAAAVVAAASR